ncbi:type II secretion system F family protein [Microseira sp. BLCC-F43]|uniref:type II secretion system F family protein n=1 Tax=Microseira sp. BLCC-F43 TaxID=3153602 RepID=UPI0035BB683B
MPTFVAQVRDAQGNTKKEKVVAETLREARTKLREQYASVNDLKEAKGFSLDFDLQTAMASVTVKDKAIFSRQFAAMVNAGVALVRALGVLTEQNSNPKMKKALTAISADVNEGISLAEAMRKHPQCFDQLYTAMVEAGEVGGVLDEVLNRIAKLLEDAARLQNQVKSAMSYPVAVGSLAVIIFIGMTTLLLPIFAKIFEDIGMELPAFTQFMLGISEFLRGPTLPPPKTNYNIILFIIGLFGAAFAYRQWYKTPPGRLAMDKFFLKAPIFGDIVEKTAVARFCRTFGTLTRSGVPILTCLEIVRDTAGNQVIANAIDKARQEIQTGGMISIALQRENVFPILAIQMISIGEETGEIDKMLMKVADFYEDEVEQAVKALTSILEPLMMIVIAVMVGAILLSMYLPMFKVFEGLG